MNSIFSSELLQSRHASRGHFIRHLENAAYALEYHLSKALPAGSTVCILHPKSILAKLLPIVAKEKKISVILVGANAQLIGALTRAGIKISTGEPDIFIGEPAGFSEHGALIPPEEAKDWRNKSVIAVGTPLQFSSHLPAKFDTVPAYMVVSELGVLPYELFSEEAQKIMQF